MQQRKLYMKGTSLNAKFWVKLNEKLKDAKRFYKIVLYL